VYASPTAPWHNTAALPQENAAFEAFYRAQGVVPEVRPPPPPPSPHRLSVRPRGCVLRGLPTAGGMQAVYCAKYCSQPRITSPVCGAEGRSQPRATARQAGGQAVRCAKGHGPGQAEWDAFLASCRSPLPVCFRVPAGPAAARIGALLRGDAWALEGRAVLPTRGAVLSFCLASFRGGCHRETDRGECHRRHRRHASPAPTRDASTGVTTPLAGARPAGGGGHAPLRAAGARGGGLAARRLRLGDQRTAGAHPQGEKTHTARRAPLWEARVTPLTLARIRKVHTCTCAAPTRRPRAHPRSGGTTQQTQTYSET
jgi:hypothetical protein